eukprot:gene22736-28895_t
MAKYSRPLHDLSKELVELLEKLFTYSSESLLALFCVENGSGEYYTWFMRLLTAGFIRRDPERFEPFLDGAYFDVASFCKGEVEPMNKECEQIQIIALTEYLGVSVNIAYLDGRLFDAETGLASVVFPDPSSGLAKFGGETAEDAVEKAPEMSKNAQQVTINEFVEKHGVPQSQKQLEMFQMGLMETAESAEKSLLDFHNLTQTDFQAILVQNQNDPELGAIFQQMQVDNQKILKKHGIMMQ